MTGLRGFRLIAILSSLAAKSAAVDSCFNTVDGTTFIEGGKVYLARCNYDIFEFNSGDGPAGNPPTFQACADLCNAASDCIAFTLGIPEGETDYGCFLKSVTTSQGASDRYSAAFLIGPANTTSSVSGSLPLYTNTSSVVSVTTASIPSGSFIPTGLGTTSSRTSASVTLSISLNSSTTTAPSAGFTSPSASVSGGLSSLFGNSTTASETPSGTSTLTSTTVSEPSSTEPSTTETGTSLSSSESLSTVSEPSTTASSGFSLTSSGFSLSEPSLTSSLPSSGFSFFPNSSFTLTTLEGSSTTEASITESEPTSISGTGISVTSGSPSVSGTGVSSSTGPSASFTNATLPATTTSASASASATSLPPSPFFALRIILSGNITAVLAPDGTIVVEGSITAIFQIIAGNLFQTGSSGLRRRDFGGKIATSPGADRVLFTPQSPPGSIDSTFEFTEFQEQLVWNNGEFYEGSARYCVVGNQLYATFAEDTSFCDYLTQVIIIPVPPGATPTVTGLPAPTSSGVVINNYNNSVTYNNNIYNYNINIDINIFNGGNFYCDGGDTFYAKVCPVCPPVEVKKSDLTYAQKPCPVCPAEILKLPPIEGYSPEKTGSDTCPYGQPKCESCEAAGPPPPECSGLTVVPAPAPSAPGGTTNIVCPTEAASSIQELASSSGPEAAATAASQAIADSGATITKTITVTAPGGVAPSTVVNVPCPTCPGGAAAATLPQKGVYGNKPSAGGAYRIKPVASGTAPAGKPGITAGSPGGVGASAAASPIKGFKGEAGAYLKPIISVLCMALASTALFAYVL